MTNKFYNNILNYKTSTSISRSMLFKSKLKSLSLLNLPRFNKNYFISLIDSHIIHYPTPITLTYAWSFG